VSVEHKQYSNFSAFTYGYVIHHYAVASVTVCARVNCVVGVCRCRCTGRCCNWVAAAHAPSSHGAVVCRADDQCRVSTCAAGRWHHRTRPCFTASQHGVRHWLLAQSSTRHSATDEMRRALHPVTGLGSLQEFFKTCYIVLLWTCTIISLVQFVAGLSCLSLKHTVSL